MSRVKLTANQQHAIARDETVQLVIFRLDDHRYALHLACVERIVRAVAITPLPKAPPIVLGVIDVAGRVIPVLNIRQRFRLPQRPITPADQFAIVSASHKTVALVIDAAESVIERSGAAIVRAAAITPGLEHIQGALQLDDGLVLIHDLERFLSLDEAHALDEALHRETSRES